MRLAIKKKSRISPKEQMRSIKTVSTIAVIGLIVAIALAIERPVLSQNFNSDTLSGSYAISITLNCGSAPPSQCAPGPYHGFVSYTSGGVAIANEILPYPPPLNTASLTEDHGNWAKVGGTHTFAVTFEKLASANQVAIATVRNRAIIQKEGDTFSGNFVTDVGSPAGTNFSVVGTGSITGKYIPVDLHPLQ